MLPVKSYKDLFRLDYWCGSIHYLNRGYFIDEKHRYASSIIHCLASTAVIRKN